MLTDQLLRRLANNTASKRERHEFWLWLTNLTDKQRREVMIAFEDLARSAEVNEQADVLLLQSIHNLIKEEEDQDALTNELARMRIRYVIAYASAAVICCLAIGIYLLPGRGRDKTKPVASHWQDIPAGKDQATLTLADGSTRVLDSTGSQSISEGNGVSAMNGNGRLVYIPAPATVNLPIFNTVTTSRANQYRLVLTDGTQVWLNAASSLRFPTRFSGNRRKVELTGEAYFDVSTDAAHPFEVSTGNATVEVLGTELNIMAYADEPALQVTLINGKMRVSRNRSSVTPGAGYMAFTDNDGLLVKEADITQVTAWKDGKIALSNLDVAAIMRQVARWYDIDVEFRGPVPGKHFFAMMDRNANLSTLLDFLDENGIHSIREGRKIIIINQ